MNFLGEDFEYSIDIESSGILTSYDWDLPEGPLVREIVEDSLRASAEAEYVLCDMDDDVERGETGGEAPFLCQSLDEETGAVTDVGAQHLPVRVLLVLPRLTGTDRPIGLTGSSGPDECSAGPLAFLDRVPGQPQLVPLRTTHSSPITPPQSTHWPAASR